MTEGVVIFLITQAFLLASTIIGIYVKVTTKLKELDLRVHFVEKQDNTILSKLDEMDDKLTDIQVDLVNKENRK